MLFPTSTITATGMLSALTFLTARAATLYLHEAAHLLAAAALGWSVDPVRLSSPTDYLRGGPAASLHVPGIHAAHASLVRHAGWLCSVCLVAVLLYLQWLPTTVTLASSWTALDAIASDLLGAPPAHDSFLCGNFGILILRAMKRSRAYTLLQQMLRVTMVRGAQSAGVVTYERQNQLVKGVRSRVVNGKRTDLSSLLLSKLKAQNGWLGWMGDAMVESGRLFQGHTRFATSSIANLAGCHPHQWTRRRLHTHWQFVGGAYRGQTASVEGYITHNGDLDLFQIHAEIYPLEDLQQLLAHFHAVKAPAEVDSAVIAGLLDLLRTKGLWFASVRYGYIYGALAATKERISMILPQLPTHAELLRLAVHFEDEWAALLAEQPASQSLSEAATAALLAPRMHERMKQLLASGTLSLKLPAGSTPDAQEQLVVQAVHAFFHNDLLEAAFTLLKGAQGSFGLVLSHSLDAERELVIAARGQTMSVAFYPSAGLVTFGSEASATKVPMCAGEKDSFRVDLDDVTGEVMLLRWEEARAAVHDGELSAPRPGRPFRLAGASERLGTEIFEYEPGKLLVGANFLEDGAQRPFWERRLQLGGNPLVSAPAGGVAADPVGSDLLEMAAVMRRIDADWTRGPEALNRITAWNFVSKLRERLLQHSAAKPGQKGSQHDGSVDLLITGCEVSLWVAEQFAADLHLIFPKLNVVAISANKLLGQLGQQYPMPQLGFRFNQHTYSLRDSVVLALSHSGGTFGTLACCNLLRGFTSNIFAMTSEWDTQVARAVRGSVKLESQFVFSTFAGFRQAEPCSISVVAMHHLLSHVLLFLMSYVECFNPGARLGGSNYAMEEVKELEMIKRKQAGCVEELVGHQALGDTPTSAQLRAQGAVWGQHVLEGPLSWLMSLAYIAATVLAHKTPCGAIAEAALGHPLPTPSTSGAPAVELVLTYVVGVVDVVLYAFLPWWTTVLLRLVQRRQWLHRVAGRSVLIGDVPWVAQAVEAFASKCFALSYSIASASFYAANPSDHLVHRHTHRVVRGSLLAVGRPDGRLNSLTTAEAACCLSVNQASSIQNMGVTCESFTIGHNPFKLPLSAGAVTLPTRRLSFVSELLIELQTGGTAPASLSLDSSLRPGCRTPLHLDNSVHGIRLDNSVHGSRKAGDFLKDPTILEALQRTERGDGQQHPSSKPSAMDGSTHGRASALLSGLDGSVHGRGATLFSGLDGSVHGGRGTGYLSQSTIIEAIVSGGSIRRGNAYVDDLVNRPSSNNTSLRGGRAYKQVAHRRLWDAMSRRLGRSSSRQPSVIASDSNDSLKSPPCSPPEDLEASITSVTSATSTTSPGLLDERSLLSVHENSRTSPFGSAMRQGSSPAPLTESSQQRHENGGTPKARVEPKKSGAKPPARSRVGVRRSSSSLAKPMRNSSLEEESTTSSHSLSGIRATLDKVQGDSDARRKLGAMALRHIFDSSRRETRATKMLDLVSSQPLNEPFLGAWMMKQNTNESVAALMERQELVQQLNETRFDSMQRLVAFFVLFHKMAKDVEEFWSTTSLGLLGYDMSRTQSILRVATTASPVGSTEVRYKIIEIERELKRVRAAMTIQRVWRGRLYHAFWDLMVSRLKGESKSPSSAGE